MRGKSGTNALLVVCCIDMVLVELPRLFLSVGMAMDGSRRESLVIMCIFVLSLLGLVGVAFGKWILLMAGLVGHALMATSGVSAILYGEFVPGFLASTACSLSVIVCALLPGVIKYVASGVSIVDSD
jgi:hypothetical protein